MEEEKIYQEIRIEFLRKFKNILYPKFIELLNKNKVKNKLFIYDKLFKRKQSEIQVISIKENMIIGIIFTIFYISLGLIFKLFLKEMSFLMFCICFILPIPIMWISAVANSTSLPELYKRKNYSRNIKEKIIPEFCKCFPSLVWTQNKIKKSVDYRNIGLPIVGVSDDSFCGNYKKTMFIIDEFVFGEDLTYGYSNFLLIKLNFNKCFKGHTVICPKGKTPAVNGLHYTQMEDVVFERKYDVYTNDDVEARYLITPTFMQKLNNLENKYKAIYTYIVFYKEKFYIFFEVKKDLFEINNKDEVFDENIYYEWFEEIILIYKLIDHFKLDQNIGM